MNKNRVNNWILPAREAIIKCGISEDGKAVIKTFRGQISSFGAAVVMGSLKSAVAFFAARGEASINRTKLVRAIYHLIEGADRYDALLKEAKNLVVQENGGKAEYEKIEKKINLLIFCYICDNDSTQLKDKVTDASIAIKLALNFFKLTEEKEKTQNGED